MTESPRRNILLMKRSLLTGRDPFFPLPVFGTCMGKVAGQRTAAASQYSVIRWMLQAQHARALPQRRSLAVADCCAHRSPGWLQHPSLLSVVCLLHLHVECPSHAALQLAEVLLCVGTLQSQLLAQLGYMHMGLTNQVCALHAAATCCC
jgi:hypothetical protein